MVFLDHHTDSGGWIGAEVARQDHSAPLALCQSVIDVAMQARFPVPQVHIFPEGDSMARGICCRLYPAHKDAPEEQNRFFPQLASLTNAMRSLLVAKFHRTDDMSLSEWLLKLRLHIEQTPLAKPDFDPSEYVPA